MRKNWDAYMMEIAHVVSSRSTCDRKHVGCVIAFNHRIISTGYNGSVPGQPHCDDEGHDMDKGHCVRTVHAEVNAVAQAARLGVSTEGADAYVNTYPCWPCFKTLLTAGVSRVVYDAEYRIDERVEHAAIRAGVKLERLKDDSNDMADSGGGNGSDSGANDGTDRIPNKEAEQDLSSSSDDP